MLLHTSEEPGKMQTYSISIRLQRTTTEYAYVSVPVNDDLLVKQADGIGRVDPAKLGEISIALGKSDEVRWHPEDQNIQMHPMQQAPEPGER